MVEAHESLDSHPYGSIQHIYRSANSVAHAMPLCFDFVLTPWYVQGVLKGAEKVVGITVNGVEANFHVSRQLQGSIFRKRGRCRLEHSVSESMVAVLRDELDAINPKRFERTESDTRFSGFQDEQSTLEESVAPGQCKDLDGHCHGEAQDIDSEVLFFSVHGPDEGPECFNGNEEIIPGYNVCATDCTDKLSSAVDKGSSRDICSADSDSTALRRHSEVSEDGCRSEETLDIPNHQNSENTDPGDTDRPLKAHISQDKPSCILSDFNESKDGAVDDSKNEHVSSSSNDNGSPNLQVENKMLDSNNVSVGPIGNESQRSVERFGASVLTEGINGSLQSPEPDNKNGKSENVETEHTSGKETGDYTKPESIVDPQDTVRVEQVEPSNPKGDGYTVTSTASTRRWKLWPIPFMKGKNIENTDTNSSNGEAFVDTKPDLQNSQAGSTLDSSRKQFIRTNVPTTEKIASLNLKDGQIMVIFNFSTRVFGNQQVDAHLYLWKWNDKIVISDVDGTITKSDVLGQFMPLVGRDWTQSGVAKLFSAIKDIKKLFPSDHNPFCAGFGNRDTDELTYLKIGIPKGKIFIINPKGEVAISHYINNARSYTLLHTLVDDMFPPASLVEQEDFNQWNFWKVPLPDI
ncbi:Lung seven transmembrane receptor family protein [Hibiscus syriacus]|uniref:Lung seven transmembrane receptor family protein n=1 Tax=Hibiscus syriacus TaxID=106335 RepID=A0A6A2WBQ2_HIBSY|nr:Lung seven transmembrane receptor family protein [Hibiscus syriacus]